MTYAQEGSNESATHYYFRPGTVLDQPDFDSLKFELRYFQWGFGAGELFAQITLTNDSVYHYRTGFIPYSFSEYDVQVVELDKELIEWESFWNILDSLDIEKLPSQQNLILIHTTEEGREVQIDNEKYFNRVMDGTAISITFIRPDTLISIDYANPRDYENLLQLHRFNCVEEHNRFNSAVACFHNFFRLEEAATQMMWKLIDDYEPDDTHDMSDKTRKKKKRKKKNGL